MELSIRRLRQAIIATAPLLTTVVLVLFSSLPTYISHVASIMPQLGIVGVFYWSIYRPDLMSYSAAFSAGLIADLLTGAPLGATALALVVVRRLVLAQRRFFLGKPFHVLWSGFLLAALAAAAVTWFAASVYLVTLVDVVPMAIQALAAALLFPPLAWLLTRCQILLPMPRGIVAQRG